MLTSHLLASALGLVCAAGLAAGHTVMAADPRATPPPLGSPTVQAIPSGNPVVARVDGTELRLSDVEAAQQNLPPQAQKLPLEQIYPILLDRLLSGAAISHARRQG